MRYVIYGAGAIGGVVGARLHQGGHDVALIARGAHLEAIRRSGLTLLAPGERVVLELPVAADPAELSVGEGDVVLLAIKGQDTAGALAALRRAGATAVPVVCLQNGVENERLALRCFADVYGAVVMTPTAHLEPGVVEAYGARMSGMIDIGRYPGGTDAVCEQVSGALRESRFISEPREDVMRLKHAKLMLNLGNAARAMCGPGAETDSIIEAAREEARLALTAAGLAFEDAEVGDLDGRWEEIDVQSIEGRERAGSSSWQSLTRGTGAIETDYLNGEIVLQGRLHGVATPVNAALCALAERYAREGRAPGELRPDEILAVAR
jgi:2-dehydropantoate 2-reductase